MNQCSTQILVLDYTRRARVAPKELFVFGTLAWRYLTYLPKVIIDCHRLIRIRWFNLNTYFCVIVTYFEQVKFWITNVQEIWEVNFIHSPSTHVLSFWWFNPKFTEKPRISRFLPRIGWFLWSGRTERTEWLTDGRTNEHLFCEPPYTKSPFGAINPPLQINPPLVCTDLKTRGGFISRIWYDVMAVMVNAPKIPRKKKLHLLCYCCPE